MVGTHFCAVFNLKNFKKSIMCIIIMEIIPFYDRKEELKEIKERLLSNKFEFIIVFGRRRIGKTHLILKALRDMSNYFYFFCTEYHNLEKIKEKAAHDYEIFNKIAVDDEIILEELFNKYDIIVFDEFPYMISENKNALNILQKLIDLKLQFSNKKLIICGSSLSFMKSEVMGYKSPLFGRKTYVLHLDEVDFLSLQEFFPEKSIEDLVRIYGFAGGVPYYLRQIPKNKDIIEFVNEDLRRKGSLIINEVDFLLKYEFKETRNYKLILEAIANGKVTIKEIKDYTYLSRTDITPYLRNLQNVGLVRRNIPIFSKPRTSKSRYFIKDNFISFWFRFISPNISYIEEGTYKIHDKEYNTYLGNIFERIAKQIIFRMKPINITKIGKWWYKDKEIDLVAVNEQTKELLAIEVKWQNLKLRDVKSIIEGLHEKLPYVQWHNERRKETLGIFAKKVDKRARDWLISEGYKVWDLGDVEKLVK